MKKELLAAIALFLLVWAVTALPGMFSRFIAGYNHFWYYPYQSLRAVVFGYLPFSLGDVLYVLGGMFVLWAVIKFIRNIFISRNRSLLIPGLLNGTVIALTIYLVFLIGWGVNYQKAPLNKTWQLDEEKDTLRLAAFDSFLVANLNLLNAGYRSVGAAAANDSAKSFYRRFTDCPVAFRGCPVKPALFSYFLDRMAIEGYFNPFTGEGQISANLPHFLLPFVVCHEMAHQAGIAAEGDANLAAYAICSQSNDSTFRYSAYLNVWLYVDRRLQRRDSVSRNRYFGRLNALTLRQLDTLEQFNKLYNNDASQLGGEMYDSYLKLQHQKQGVHSYSNIVLDAWRLEAKRRRMGTSLIMLKYR